MSFKRVIQPRPKRSKYAFLEGLSDITDYVILPLKSDIEPEKQAMLKDFHFPQKWKSKLAVKCDLGVKLGINIRHWYPRAWTYLTKEDLDRKNPRLGIHYHILTDDEIHWMLGETHWLCTAKRRGFGITPDSCAVYPIFHRQGTEFGQKEIIQQYPSAFGSMTEYDTNSINHLEIYSYEPADNDIELNRFFFQHPIVLDSNPAFVEKEKEALELWNPRSQE